MKQRSGMRGQLAEDLPGGRDQKAMCKAECCILCCPCNLTGVSVFLPQTTTNHLIIGHFHLDPGLESGCSVVSSTGITPIGRE